MNYTDEQIANFSNSKNRQVNRAVSNIKNRYQGSDDGVLNRFGQGMAINGLGLLDNAEDLIKFINSDYNKTGFDKTREELKQRQRNYEEYNQESNVAGMLGDLVSYAPELLVPQARVGGAIARGLKDGVKYGLANFALGKAYGNENATEDAIATGLIGGGITSMFGKSAPKNFRSRDFRKSNNSASNNSDYTSSASSSDNVYDVIEAELIDEPLRLRSVSHEFNKGTNKLNENVKSLSHLLQLTR